MQSSFLNGSRFLNIFCWNTLELGHSLIPRFSSKFYSYCYSLLSHPSQPTPEKYFSTLLYKWSPVCVTPWGYMYALLGKRPTPFYSLLNKACTDLCCTISSHNLKKEIIHDKVAKKNNISIIKNSWSTKILSTIWFYVTST